MTGKFCGYRFGLSFVHSRWLPCASRKRNNIDKHLTAELARWREVVKSTRIKAE